MLFSLLENLEKEESEKMERLNTAQLNYFHNHNKNEKDALLLEYTIPLSITDVHEFCITKVQKRNINIKNENNNNIPLHLSHSPNPLLPSEFNILENYIFNLLQPHIPFLLNVNYYGVVSSPSFLSTAVFSIYARGRVKKVTFFLETLKINALYHFCGLTDVLLHQTFPNYNVVLPSLAFGLAIFTKFVELA
ncbi:hypothetical protein AGDE_09527 [Angomonas deanei]|uniref:Uncharacterized protein n=1 Tax=Angomonas deanei TaxID=59799 RepID=A0A7G2CUI4_9TRYP|nr:hypothetical protein AGDE_09527 [Angomonas deanei]CAD2222959.1 hypothetical protein, conserved [Angomonas deanei]|eukprot:EPY30272.1 hypothetical protein AGDE_09527 [Angomonas deanei]